MSGPFTSDKYFSQTAKNRFSILTSKNRFWEKSNTKQSIQKIFNQKNRFYKESNRNRTPLSQTLVNTLNLDLKLNISLELKHAYTCSHVVFITHNQRHIYSSCRTIACRSWELRAAPSHLRLKIQFTNRECTVRFIDTDFAGSAEKRSDRATACE